MEATTKWLDRLHQANAGNLREYPLPILTPGIQCLDLNNCIISTEPMGVLQPRPGDTSPISMGILRYVDLAQDDPNLQHQEELVGELSALISLVAERRVTVPKVLAVTVPGVPRVTFLAYGAAVDRRLHGPIAHGLEPSIHHLLAQVAGLPVRIRVSGVIKARHF